MSISIKNIGIYIPDRKIDNVASASKLGRDSHFVDKRLGIRKRAVKEASEKASDLALRAIGDLERKVPNVLNDLDALVVITQTGDYAIPHTSAIVHGKLKLKESVSCFDISLGCSGYIYGLSLLKSHMLEMGYKKALLITSDPYSEVVDPLDSSTALLFGDAATATLLSYDGVYLIERPILESNGADWEALYLDGHLIMDGKKVLNFASKNVTAQVDTYLKERSLTTSEIDLFLMHQGSKVIIDNLRKKIGVDERKMPFMISGYGNTVSSSIPLMLSHYIDPRSEEAKNVIISGFGVGLSWGTMLLRKV